MNSISKIDKDFIKSVFERIEESTGDSEKIEIWKKEIEMNLYIID